MENKMATFIHGFFQIFFGNFCEDDPIFKDRRIKAVTLLLLELEIIIISEDRTSVYICKEIEEISERYFDKKTNITSDEIDKFIKKIIDKHREINDNQYPSEKIFL